MVTFVDPRGVPATETLPYDLADPLADGAVIGLMANGFPDSDTFLDCVADAVGDRLPGVSFTRFNKGNASRLADEAMLAEVAGTCTAVIAAYGH
jgi:hypothetical protein